jgi:cobalt-zinc-cadmium efflux system protein
MTNHTHPQHDHTHYGLPFFLILGFAFFEAWGGWWTHSLALLSDAGHMFTDVLSLGLAWLAANLAGRPNVKKHCCGLSYPELWASFINITLMAIVIVGIVTEALMRLKSPPNVDGGSVVWIALIGLIVNLIVAKQLQHQAHEHGENLNNQAAYLHVLGDLLGSIAAITAGAVIYFTGWQKIDPILSLLSALLLTVMTFGLAYRLYTSFAEHAHD